MSVLYKKVCDALRDAMDAWMRLDDAALLVEVQRVFPIVASATRGECLKFLTMDFVYTAFGATP